MGLILHLETATDICSVCIAKDGILLGTEESKAKNSHASHLHVLIDTLLKKLNFSYSDPDAFAVSMGPGSYTGLRIGVTAAKGFCFSLDKPLIAINTLQAMTDYFISMNPVKTNSHDILYCPMLDARRMEVYIALFDSKLNFKEDTKALILDEHSFAEVLEHHPVCFFGDGSVKFRNLIKPDPKALFAENFSTSSEGLVQLSHKAYLALDFKDLAYFEPFYLKDFVTGSKNSPKDVNKQ